MANNIFTICNFVIILFFGHAMVLRLIYVNSKSSNEISFSPSVDEVEEDDE